VRPSSPAPLLELSAEVAILAGPVQDRLRTPHVSMRRTRLAVTQGQPSPAKGSDSALDSAVRLAHVLISCPGSAEEVSPSL